MLSGFGTRAGTGSASFATFPSLRLTTFLLLLLLAGCFLPLSRPLFDTFADEISEIFKLPRGFVPEIFEHLRIKPKPIAAAETLYRAQFIFVISSELARSHRHYS